MRSTSASSPPADLLTLRRNVIAELKARGIDWRSTKSRSDGAFHQSDPVVFIREALKSDLWEVQEQIAHAVSQQKRVAVRSCHHSGKTHLSAALVCWWLNAFDHSLVITTAPTDRQMREQLWVEIAGHHRKSELPGRITETSLEIGPSRRAFGFSTNTPERFQGWHEQNILVIVDEASGVAEPIYQAIEGILTGHNAKLLLIGNPNSPQGTFYEAFRSPLYQTFHISAHDVPERLLPASWAEERLQEWGADNPAYQVRVLGDFPQQGADALISMKWVEDAIRRELDPVGDFEFGVDVAEYGDDESYCYVRRGPKVVHSSGWRHNDPIQSAGQVIAIYNGICPGQAATIKVDDIGIGAGTRAALQNHFADSRLVTVHGLNVGEAAIDTENYANKRSEVFCGLRDRFKDFDIDFDEDTTLKDQLTQIKFSYSPRGQIKLESKEEMRKRRATGDHRWKSPDRADALSLCFATAGPRWLPFAEAGEARDAWS